MGENVDVVSNKSDLYAPSHLIHYLFRKVNQKSEILISSPFKNDLELKTKYDEELQRKLKI